MKMEPVRKKLAWSKPTVRVLSADEVIRMFAQEPARRAGSERWVKVKPYTA